jgi:hypothetical protein
MKDYELNYRKISPTNLKFALSFSPLKLKVISSSLNLISIFFIPPPVRARLEPPIMTKTQFRKVQRIRDGLEATFEKFRDGATGYNYGDVVSEWFAMQNK